jgi:serine/threonine-protein kinase/endoribonuclease IRE1
MVMDDASGRHQHRQNRAAIYVLFAALVLAVAGQIAVPQSLAEPDARRNLAPLSAEDAHAPRRARSTEGISRLLGNSTKGKYTISAIEPLALTGQLVTAPQVPRRGGAALSYRSQPRDLQDFELEDIVLLATIDGSIHACDRRTGRERWSLDFPDNPMIHTTNYPRNRSNENDAEAADDFIFIVEPSREGTGNIYVQNRNPSKGGLQKLPSTVQDYARMRPIAIADDPYTFTSRLQSSLYTIDAATGTILKRLDADDPFVNRDGDRSCPRVDPFGGESQECEPIGTFVLGRMDYVISLRDAVTSEALCQIKYSEWTINTQDTELQNQHDAGPLEGRQIYSFSNGQIMGTERADEYGGHKWRAKFESPVAQVFDIVRPVDTRGSPASLVILSQPLVLPQDEQSLDLYQGISRDRSKVFVNKTAKGSYFLMSEEQFPFSTSYSSWSKVSQGIDTERSVLDPDSDEDYMTGIHRLIQSSYQHPRLDAPASYDNTRELATRQDGGVATLPSPSPNLREGISTYIAVFVLPVLLWFIFELSRGTKPGLKLAAQIERLTGIRIYAKAEIPVTVPGKDINQENPSGRTPDTDSVTRKDTSPDDHTVPALEGKHARQNSGKSSSDADSGEWEKMSAIPETEENVAEDAVDNDDDQTHDGDEEEPQEAQPSKKSRTLPRIRGGKKNNKKKKAKALEDSLTNVVQTSEKEATSITGLVQPVSLDGQAAMPEPTFVPELQLESGLTQVGVITVDQTLGSRLGDGSNGTIVFRGTCFSRAVAVKRLIRSPKNFAAAEIKHLPKLDSHPNVVRFHSVQESQNFTWIALELYTTSLDKIVEHPELYPDLVHKAGLDVNDVLCQVARGIEHLHARRVVHRDIKPQNVLVRLLEPAQQPVTGRPKLEVVLSDFGLCKMLDDGPGSAFALTGNHTAAGTTGWKAPELLAGGPSTTIVVDAGSSGTSNPTSTSSEVAGERLRRPGKSIDIFSLGCLFFYVMTQGGHPFDHGGSYARDLNIKEGKSDTHDLLSFHSYTYEADDLILQMISHEPENRPTATQVLQHPYFWPTDRKLQLLCDVSDCYERQKNTLVDDKETRASSSSELDALEAKRIFVWTGDFLKRLPPRIITEAGKQRKYTGTRMIDLLRLIRNKKNHFHDLPDEVKFGDMAGTLDGYYHFWSAKFPSLLVNIHCLIIERELKDNADFRELRKYFD